MVDWISCCCSDVSHDQDDRVSCVQSAMALHYCAHTLLCPAFAATQTVLSEELACINHIIAEVYKKHIADYYSYPIYTLKPLGLLGVHFKLDGKHESDHE